MPTFHNCKISEFLINADISVIPKNLDARLILVAPNLRFTITINNRHNVRYDTNGKIPSWIALPISDLSLTIINVLIDSLVISCTKIQAQGNITVTPPNDGESLFIDRIAVLMCNIDKDPSKNNPFSSSEYVSLDGTSKTNKIKRTTDPSQSTLSLTLF